MAYKRSAIRDIEAIEGKSFNALVQEKRDFYRANGVEPKDAEAEVIADYTAKLFDDHNLIDKLVKRDYNTASLLLDGVKDIYNNLKTKFTGKEIGGVEETVRYLERALGMRSSEGSGTAFSIITLPDGRKYVQADRQVIYTNNPDNWGKEVENYINESIRRGEDVEFVTDDGDVIKITEDTAWKVGDMTEWTEESFPIKMNMGTHIDELLKVSKYDGSESAGDRTNKRFKPDSFDYRTAFFRDFNGEYYRVSISVGTMPNGKVAYNIGKNIKKRSFPDPRGSSSEKQRRSNIKKASTDRVPYSEEYVNTYSTQNSEKDANEKSEMQLALEKAGIDSETFSGGKQFSVQKLTEEQREAIKSQEGLTEEGKLLYNGSNNWAKEDSLYAKRSEDFRRIQEESKRMSNKDTQSYHAGSKQIDDDVRRRLSGIFRRELGSQRSSTGDDDGILILSDKKTGNTFRMYKNVDGSLFHDIFEISRQFLKNGELVDVHDVETTDDGAGYSNCANYITDDGLSGFSITPSGDLISVFNLNERRGFLRAISKVVRSTAKTLDCYNSQKQPLMGMYSKIFGFKTASLMDYNMEFDHDDIAENHGMPQIAFMVNTDAEVETKHFNKDEYEEAVEYQQSFINPKYSIQKLTEEQREAIKAQTKSVQYKDLINHEDIMVVQVDDENVSGDVISTARKNALSKGHPLNTDSVIMVKNKDLGIDILISRKGLNHAYERSDRKDTEIVNRYIGDYLENAIYINELVGREDEPTVKKSYVLLGYGESKNASYPAYFIINVKSDGRFELEEYGVLKASKGRKIEGSSAQLRNMGLDSNVRPKSVPSTISISNLLSIVNEKFSDILPISVLQHYKIRRGRSQLEKDIKYSIQNLTPEQQKAIDDDRVVSQFYTNSLQKEMVTPAVKEVDSAMGHKYKPISNAETYKRGKGYVIKTGFEEAKGELEDKFMRGAPLSSEEVARAEYIFTQLQKDGKVKDAVRFAEEWNNSVTEGARALQALQIIDRLTPEGKFLYVTRQAQSITDKQTENLKGKKKEAFEKEMAEAKKKDAEIKKRLDTIIKNYEDMGDVAAIMELSPEEFKSRMSEMRKDIEGINEEIKKKSDKITEATL